MVRKSRARVDPTVRAPGAGEATRFDMSDRKESVFEGKTLDDAVRLGLDALGLSRAEVMITVLEEGSGGFLGLGARPYKVRVMPRPGGPPREPAARGERDRGREGREGRGRRERGRPGAGRGDARGGRGGDRAREGRGEPQRAGRAEGRDEPQRAGRTEGRDEPQRAGRTEGRDEGRGGERDRGREGRGGDRGRERAGREPALAEDAAPRGDAPGEERPPYGEAGGRRRRRGRRGGRGRDDRPMETGPRESGAVAVAPDAPMVHGDEPAMAAALPPREPRERPRRDEGRERPRRDEGREREARPTGPMLPAAELEARAVRATDELLRAMGFEARVTAKADGENVDVTAEVPQGEDLLVGRKGEVRQALQHLLNLTVNRGEGMRYHLQLEINEFWRHREKELEDLARSMADDAVARGGEVMTEYLNAQERRIIHVTLREDPRVKTYAIGDGLIKKLAVAPADAAEESREPS
jgi:predicted RNA-binding protein Jag